MGILSKKEKEELLRLSRSAKLRKDFQKIRENRFRCRLNNSKITLDDYIKFLTISNLFANHRQKPFRKIEGRNFKI